MSDRSAFATRGRCAHFAFDIVSALCEHSLHPLMEATMTLSRSTARAIAAIELRHAGSLRRDAAAGRLPRAAAISAIRDCLRHAAYANRVAALLAT